MTSEHLIYKIVHRESWATAESDRVFKGVDIDLQDGFIHFSAAGQVAETLDKHFPGQRDLLLVAVDPDVLGDSLKWEPSRGGELFPHLYSPLELEKVSFVEEILLDDAGNHQFSLPPIE